MRVDPVHDSGELPNELRSRLAVATELLGERLQTRRSERLPLQALQNIRKKQQAFRVARDSFDYRMRLSPQRAPEKYFDHQNDQDRRIGARRQIKYDRCNRG